MAKVSLAEFKYTNETGILLLIHGTTQTNTLDGCQTTVIDEFQDDLRMKMEGHPHRPLGGSSSESCLSRIASVKLLQALENKDLQDWLSSRFSQAVIMHQIMSTVIEPQAIPTSKRVVRFDF